MLSLKNPPVIGCYVVPDGTLLNCTILVVGLRQVHSRQCSGFLCSVHARGRDSNDAASLQYIAMVSFSNMAPTIFK